MSTQSFIDTFQRNRAEFAHLDEVTRAQFEGFRPGIYVRVQIDNMPCELITNHDPNYPLVVGGLLSSEYNIGYIQVRDTARAMKVNSQVDKVANSLSKPAPITGVV